jgi:hypothetical protein
MKDTVKQVVGELGEIEYSVGVTEEELEVLARHYADDVDLVSEMSTFYGSYGSGYWRAEVTANVRLNMIRTVLGDDRVNKIIEDVNKWRFVTRCYELPHIESADSPKQTPETRLFYTDHGCAIVFHHSGIGFRDGVRPNVGQLTGWCWQSASDFKEGKPVEHGGYLTSKEALRAAKHYEFDIVEDCHACAAGEMETRR